MSSNEPVAEDEKKLVGGSNNGTPTATSGSDGVSSTTAPVAEPVDTQDHEPVATSSEIQEVKSEGGDDEEGEEVGADGDENAKKRGSAPADIISRTSSMRDRQQNADEEEKKRLLCLEVPLAYVLGHIEKQADSKVLMRQLVVYIIFLVILSLYGFSRRSTMEEHFATSGLFAALGDRELPPQKYFEGAELNSGTHFPKPFRDLANQNDWYDWFEDVVLPVFFDNLNRTQRNAKSGPLPTHELVGALRVRSYRVNEGVGCTVREEYYPNEAYQRQCYPAFAEDYIDTEPVFYNSSTGEELTIPFVDGCENPFQEIWGRIATYPCGGLTYDLNVTMNFNEAMDIARKLRAMEFVNMSTTRLVAVEFITWVNGLDAFVSGKMYAEITKGGGWVPTSRLKSFRMWSDEGKHESSHGASLALDIVFTLFVFYYWVRLFRYFFFGRENPRSLKFFFDIWNFLELVNLLGLVCNLAFHFVGRSVAISLQEDDGFVLPITGQYIEKLNYIMELYYLEVYFIALNTVIAYLKILMYLRLHSRLGILTRTLERASQDIAGVLIIFILLVTAYAAAGYILYGTALISFHNTSYSFSSLFLMLMGTFDYEAMRQEQMNLTAIYFWSYTILALFAMLNFITAIIGKGFDEEVAKVAQLPLHAQIRRARKALMKTSVLQNCATMCSRRRFRQDIITDFLHEYRKTLLSMDNLTQEALNSGAEDEPEYMLTRNMLGQMIPQKEVDYITDEYLDDLWQEIAEDHEVESNNEEAVEEKKLTEAYEKGMSQAFVSVFLSKRNELTATQNILLRGKNAVGEEEGRERSKQANDDLMNKRDILLSGGVPPATARGTRSGEASLNTSRRPNATSPAPPGANNKPGSGTAMSSEDAKDALIGDDISDEDVNAAIRAIVERAETRARLQSTQTSGVEHLSVRVQELENAMTTVETLLNKASHKIVAKHK